MVADQPAFEQRAVAYQEVAGTFVFFEGFVGLGLQTGALLSGRDGLFIHVLRIQVKFLPKLLQQLFVSLEIPLVLFEIILLRCEFPDISIEIPTNYYLELPLVLPIDLQQMRHKNGDLPVLFILPGAKME